MTVPRHVTLRSSANRYMRACFSVMKRHVFVANYSSFLLQKSHPLLSKKVASFSYYLFCGTYQHSLLLPPMTQEHSTHFFKMVVQINISYFYHFLNSAQILSRISKNSVQNSWFIIFSLVIYFFQLESELYATLVMSPGWLPDDFPLFLAT